MKQKCREELLQWEVEPMPDLSREPEVDQCVWWANQPEGKFPVLRVVAACYFGRQLGANPSERHWSKCKNTTGIKRTNLSSESLDKLMIINSCLKNMRGIRYDSAPILPNPFLDSHLNKLDTRNNARNHTLDQNELPSDTDDDEDLDVQVIEVQMPNVQGVIARSSDAEEGDGSDTEAPNLFSQQTEEAHAPRFRCSGSLRAQEEVVMETQDSPAPRITREGTLLQEEDEEESPALVS